MAGQRDRDQHGRLEAPGLALDRQWPRGTVAITAGDEIVALSLAADSTNQPSDGPS